MNSDLSWLLMSDGTSSYCAMSNASGCSTHAAIPRSSTHGRRDVARRPPGRCDRGRPTRGARLPPRPRREAAPEAPRPAVLASRRAPDGPLLLAEEDGVLRAALSLRTGAVVADP